MELYEYTVFFNDYDKGNSYFRKVKKLRKIEYMQVLALIKWRIGKKDFKIISKLVYAMPCLCKNI